VLRKHEAKLGLGQPRKFCFAQRVNTTLSGLLSLLLLASFIASPSHAAEPLNVVFILADDLGWSDLKCYGADLHQTPHLDRLAGEGVRFTQAYAACVCSPTRASLMTGKHPTRLHITIWEEASQNPPRNRKLIPPITVGNLPHEEVTIAERLRGAGYLTALVGKWHLGEASFYPETQGFDINIGGTHWGAPQTFFYPYSGQGTFGSEYRYVPHLEFGKPGEYLTDRLTDEAIKIIEQAKDRPFFVYLAHHAPHTPIEAPPELVAEYERKITPGLHHRNAKYAAMVHNLDANVGRLLQRLDDLKLTERTVVVFMSDNGGFINGFQGMPVTDNTPLRSGKGSLYEGGVRVPLIVRWPGVTPRGAICNEPVISMDLFPTLLAAAGLKPESPVDGLSLASLLKNPGSRLGREALYFHYPHYYQTTAPVSSVRAGEYKLMEYFEDDHVELYSLKDDPSEQKDLSGAMPDLAAKLRGQLQAWRKEVAAQMPVVNPDFKPGKAKKK
jgi:arylsulfatase A